MCCQVLTYYKTWVEIFNLRDVNFEIIIVDDGSPDGTQDIVKQLQQVYGEDRVVSILKICPRSASSFILSIQYHGLMDCL